MQRIAILERKVQSDQRDR